VHDTEKIYELKRLIIDSYILSDHTTIKNKQNIEKMIDTIKDDEFKQELFAKLSEKENTKTKMNKQDNLNISLKNSEKDLTKGGDKSRFAKKKNKEVDSNAVIEDPLNLTEKE
jgi:hypothetical protein